MGCRNGGMGDWGMNELVQCAMLASQRAMPWRSVLTSLPVLAITAARVAFNWGYLLIMAMLPLYMQEVLKVDLASVGVALTKTHQSKPNHFTFGVILLKRCT